MAIASVVFELTLAGSCHFWTTYFSKRVVWRKIYVKVTSSALFLAFFDSFTQNELQKPKQSRYEVAMIMKFVAYRKVNSKTYFNLFQNRPIAFELTLQAHFFTFFTAKPTTDTKKR